MRALAHEFAVREAPAFPLTCMCVIWTSWHQRCTMGAAKKLLRKASRCSAAHSLQWTRPWFLLIIVTAPPGLGLQGSMELLLRRPADGRNARTASWLDPRAEQNWWSWQERLEDVGQPKLRLFSASSRQHAPVLRLLCCGRGLNRLGGSGGSLLEQRSNGGGDGPIPTSSEVLCDQQHARLHVSVVVLWTDFVSFLLLKN